MDAQRTAGVLDQAEISSPLRVVVPSSINRLTREETPSLSAGWSNAHLADGRFRDHERQAVIFQQPEFQPIGERDSLSILQRQRGGAAFLVGASFERAIAVSVSDTG